MEEFSGENMCSNATQFPHFSNCDSEPPVTSMSDMTCSGDQIVEQKHDGTCRSLTKLITSLVNEIQIQRERIDELEEDCKKKDAACESTSRLVISLLQEIDFKNEELVDLNCKCREMCCDLNKLVAERDWLHKICIQGETRMQSLNSRNRKLKNDLRSVHNELRQVVQSGDGPQSDQGQRCSTELVGTVDSKTTDIGALIKELEEKTDEVLYLQNLNQTLILKERASNNELLDGQQELLRGMHAVLSNRTMLGIKRMGELNTKPFLDACAEKFPSEEQGLKCAEVCSLWEDCVKDSNWHPFKHCSLNGKLQEVIDESDEKLQDLRKEWGEEAYKAVTSALVELNEYNPSGRYPIPKIWNFREGKIASLKEVIGYLITQLKTHKRKRS